jgi:hypothetical protein
MLSPGRGKAIRSRERSERLACGVGFERRGRVPLRLKRSLRSPATGDILRVLSPGRGEAIRSRERSERLACGVGFERRGRVPLRLKRSLRSLATGDILRMLSPGRGEAIRSRERSERLARRMTDGGPPSPGALATLAGYGGHPSHALAWSRRSHPEPRAKRAFGASNDGRRSPSPGALATLAGYGGHPSHALAWSRRSHP